MEDHLIREAVEEHIRLPLEVDRALQHRRQVAAARVLVATQEVAAVLPTRATLVVVLATRDIREEVPLAILGNPEAQAILGTLVAQATQDTAAIRATHQQQATQDTQGATAGLVHQDPHQLAGCRCSS